MNPNFKVALTHCGETTNYVSALFDSLNVKRRENHYDVATLTCKDPNSYYSTFKIAKFDDIKIYFKKSTQTNYTSVFGGTLRQVNPVLTTGKNVIVNCKGYGAALESTNCNRDYGTESKNPSYPQPWNIWNNVIDEFVEKSFDGGATGHVLDHTLITDTFATDIRYINNPYRTNSEVINAVCNLTSAIGAGTAAGAHWIVDPDAYFMVAKIGDHAAGAGSPETRWPDWWNYLENDSYLTEGIDFTGYSVLDKAEEYANHVILITDFRRPAYDYWTESGSALWGNTNLDSITDENGAGLFVVGANSLKFDPNDDNTVGYGYYPSTEDADWDITKWGSEKTIPTLNFYAYHHNLNDAHIHLNETGTADYFTLPLYSSFITATEDKWVNLSIPVGPYWASSAESRELRWAPSGTPAWSAIKSITFTLQEGDPGAYLLIDDLHFTGKIIRSAKDASEITRVKEYQKVLIARNSMDDTCVAGVGAGKDDGFAARIAYAELLRRTNLPLTVTFTLKHGEPKLIPGQKAHVQLCKRANGSFKIDSVMRLLTVEHNMDNSGFTSTVTATTDLLNSFPMSVPDQYAMWMENMFILSNEAKNIRAGSEVDLLIPMLESSY